MNKTTRNIILLAILAILLIVVAMNVGGDSDSAEVRPVAEDSVKAPGSGIKIGNTQ